MFWRVKMYLVNDFYANNYLKFAGFNFERFMSYWLYNGIQHQIHQHSLHLKSITSCQTLTHN